MKKRHGVQPPCKSRLCIKILFDVTNQRKLRLGMRPAILRTFCHELKECFSVFVGCLCCDRLDGYGFDDASMG